MRLDGSFQGPPPQVGVPTSLKLMVGATLIALGAGAVAFAALALWVLSMVLPVILVAGVVAWGALRFRRWQATRNGSGSRSVY